MTSRLIRDLHSLDGHPTRTFAPQKSTPHSQSKHSGDLFDFLARIIQLEANR
jgi:hypothetical protein